MPQLPLETWLVDFYKNGLKIETKEIKRAYAPTRWAHNHKMVLRRHLKGAEVTFSITRMS